MVPTLYRIYFIPLVILKACFWLKLKYDAEKNTTKTKKRVIIRRMRTSGATYYALPTKSLSLSSAHNNHIWDK